MTHARLEVCVDTAAGIATCAKAGVDRIELCAALSIAGLTPSAGLMRLAADCGVPTHAMIRPRAGGFCFDRDDLAQMCTDIASAAHCGLAGVVIGAADRDGMLDIAALAQLMTAAGDMSVTLHRVIDLCPDPLLAIDQAHALGVGRILTSGGQRTATKGISRLADMNAYAAGRLTIMAGSGVTATNAGDIADATGIRDFHASCAVSRAWPDPVQQLGFGEHEKITDMTTIKALQSKLRAI